MKAGERIIVCTPGGGGWGKVEDRRDANKEQRKDPKHAWRGGSHESRPHCKLNVKQHEHESNSSKSQWQEYERVAATKRSFGERQHLQIGHSAVIMQATYISTTQSRLRHIQSRTSKSLFWF
jgi:hypothetical protein